MKGKSDYYWLLVTPDKYELPLYVADSAQELADYCGVIRNTIYSTMSRHSERSRYKRVKKEGKV